MLQTFRESTGRIIAIALLGLIAVTFIFFGIDFSVSFSTFAAKVNGEDIPMAEFDRELQATQNEYQQVYRTELTDDMRRELRRSVIDQLVLREALRQRTEEAGYRVSDARLAQALRQTAAFQIGGEFSRDVYNSRLAAEGMSPTYYEARQREQLELLDLQTGIVASTFLTPAEYRRYIELFRERRRIGYAEFAVDDFLPQVEISDAQVSDYYADNESRYMTEESVDIEYIELDLASVAENVEVTDDDIRAYYDDNPDQFGTAEERRVSHILIEVDGDDYAAAEAEAESVLQRLRDGADFAELASEVSDDGGTRNQGGDLGWISRGTLPGAFEDALFSMQVGDIEGPVETEFGYHILKLEDLREGQVQPLAAVYDDIREMLQNEQASGLFFDRANELADASFDAFNELTTVAMNLGLELKTIDGLTRSNAGQYFTNGDLITQAAFDEDALISGENSSLLELSDEDVAVLRVTGHHAPEPRPLEEVSDVIRDELARNEAGRLAGDAAAAFVEALGSDYDQAGTLAEEHGGSWVEPDWAERDDADLPQELLAVAFAEPKPAEGEVSVDRVPLRSGDEAVLLLYAVEPGDPDVLPVGELDQERQQLANESAQAEMAGYAGNVRDEARVRIPDEVLNPQF